MPGKGRSAFRGRALIYGRKPGYSYRRVFRKSTRYNRRAMYKPKMWGVVDQKEVRRIPTAIKAQRSFIVR